MTAYSKYCPMYNGTDARLTVSIITRLVWSKNRVCSAESSSDAVGVLFKKSFFIQWPRALAGLVESDE